MRTKRYHLIVDITKGNTKITDIPAMEAFLKTIVKKVEMEILQGPYITKGHVDNPGLTGIVLVDFSHIAVHTFSETDEVLIDVFSCKPYDQELVKQYCREYYGTPDSEIREKIVWWGE